MHAARDLRQTALDVIKITMSGNVQKRDMGATFSLEEFNRMMGPLGVGALMYASVNQRGVMPPSTAKFRL